MKISLVNLVYIIIVISAFIVFFRYGYSIDKRAQASFREMEFHGVIKEIIYSEGKRGFPDLQIDNQWIFLGLNGEKIQNHIKVSDSIVKNSGTETIKIYRKNNKKGWDEKVFK
jgi:hypothetical protein